MGCRPFPLAVNPNFAKLETGQHRRAVRRVWPEVKLASLPGWQVNCDPPPALPQKSRRFRTTWKPATLRPGQAERNSTAPISRGFLGNRRAPGQCVPASRSVSRPAGLLLPAISSRSSQAAPSQYAAKAKKASIPRGPHRLATCEPERDMRSVIHISRPIQITAQCRRAPFANPAGSGDARPHTPAAATPPIIPIVVPKWHFPLAPAPQRLLRSPHRPFPPAAACRFPLTMHARRSTR